MLFEGFLLLLLVFWGWPELGISRGVLGSEMTIDGWHSRYPGTSFFQLCIVDR